MKTLKCENIFLVLILCIIFFACNSGDEFADEGDNKDDSQSGQIDELSTDEKLLVGKWLYSNSPLFLYSDKTCITPDKNSGTYKFDVVTKELITTSGWGIWIVKSLDDTAMVLQNVSSGKVMTYKRQYNFVDKECRRLLIGRWQKKDDPNTILTIDSEKCILDSNGTLTERFYSVKGEGDAAYLYMNDYYGYPTLEHVDYYTLILAWNKRFSGTYQRIQN